MSEPLYEKYRPKTLEEVVGQPGAVKRLARVIEQGAVAGRAWWISGRSGNGKTTIARILAATVADPFCTEEYDGREVSMSLLREICKRHRHRGFGIGGWAVIVNEAHNVKDATRFLGVLEPIPAHVAWIFTTTVQGQLTFDGLEDSNAFLSRCRREELVSRGVADAFATLAQQIAQTENLDGKPLKAYKELVNQCRGNMRAVLQAIEDGVMA